MSGNGDGSSLLSAGGRRVLIADDDDDVREMLALYLEDHGFDVAVARDGREALDRMLNEEFHVVVLDNRMPELTGAEVYRMISAQGRRVPVVFVTAAAHVQELAALLGIKCFLGKPFKPAELLAALEQAPLRCA